MSDFTAQPSQPQPGQPQPYQPAQPPKRKTHKFRNFVVFPVVGLVALIVIISATSGGGDDSGTSGNTGTTAKAPADRGQPRPVTVGTAFTIGKHRLDAGWKLTHQPYLGSQVTGTVTNVSKSTSTAIFHIKFLKGSTVVGNMQCSTNDLEAGQSEAVTCLNTVTGDTNLLVKGSYDKVTAEATF
jgi:hypothetical protein